jgi:hypothetical protein
MCLIDLAGGHPTNPARIPVVPLSRRYGIIGGTPSSEGNGDAAAPGSKVT